MPLIEVQAIAPAPTFTAEEYRQAAQACRVAALVSKTNAAVQPDPSAALMFNNNAEGLEQIARKLDLNAAAAE